MCACAQKRIKSGLPPAAAHAPSLCELGESNVLTPCVSARCLFPFTHIIIITHDTHTHTHRCTTQTMDSQTVVFHSAALSETQTRLETREFWLRSEVTLLSALTVAGALSLGPYP